MLSRYTHCFAFAKLGQPFSIATPSVWVDIDLTRRVVGEGGGDRIVVGSVTRREREDPVGVSPEDGVARHFAAIVGLDEPPQMHHSGRVAEVGSVAVPAAVVGPVADGARGPGTAVCGYYEEIEGSAWAVTGPAAPKITALTTRRRPTRLTQGTIPKWGQTQIGSTVPRPSGRVRPQELLAPPPSFLQPASESLPLTL